MVYMRGPVAPAWRGSLKISCTYQAGAAFINIEVISSDGAAVGDRGRTHRFQKDSIPECNNVILRANVTPNPAALSTSVRICSRPLA
jgi:hypothetical protein